MDFLPLPTSAPLTIDALAHALAHGLADRAAAERRLAAEVLPWRLRGLADHPRPDDLSRVVYDDLVERLGAVPVAGRTQILDELVCETTSDRLVGEATSLAVARYFLDHPGAAGGDPWRRDAARWQGLAAYRLATEADARGAELDRLVKTAPPACSRAIGQKAIHARMALGSARTGSFATAAGMLLDFLRSVGQQPQTLDVH